MKQVYRYLGLLFLVSFPSLTTAVELAEHSQTTKVLQPDKNLSTKHELANKGDKKWILVLKDPRSERRKRRGHRRYRAPKSYENDRLLDRYSQILTEKYALELIEQWPIASLKVHCLVVRAKDSLGIDINAIEKDEQVEWVQAFQEFEVLGKRVLRTASVDESTIQLEKYSDPYLNLQTTYKQLELDKVDSTINGDGVIVAMVDSGIEIGHPDLRDADIIYENFVSASTPNKQLLDDSERPAEHHGTGIAGVIMAQQNNGQGIAGIAPNAKLYVMRGCWELKNGNTRCNTLSLSRALDRTLQVSPDILNLSLSGPQDRLLDSLLEVIIERGTLVVAAYDERRGEQNRFPEMRDGVVMARHPQSNVQGDYFFLPGKEIITLQPTSTYAFLSGNSLSSAHLTGILALAKQIKSDLNLIDLLNGVRSTGVANELLSACDLFAVSGASSFCRP